MNVYDFTVTAQDAVFPPSRAVATITAVPGTRPFTIPSAETVATFSSLLLQVY